MKKLFVWKGNKREGWKCPRSGYSIIPYGRNARKERIYDIRDSKGFSVTGEANVAAGLKATANREAVRQRTTICGK